MCRWIADTSQQKHKDLILLALYRTASFISPVTSNMYRSSEEARRIFDLLRQNSERLGLPVDILTSQVQFYSDSDTIYYPIPFKVTETLAALKGIEGALAALIADLQSGTEPHERKTTINLERATLFGFQALVTKIDGYSRSDPEVKRYLKGETSRCLFHGAGSGV